MDRDVALKILAALEAIQEAVETIAENYEPENTPAEPAGT